jgi:lipid II:glycine glycyltransferase (peptidoglycan interpeptide bridge formation enzyme)
MVEEGVAAGPGADRWAAWDRFVAATPTSGFMQTSWWAEFRAMAGYRNFGAMIRQRGVVLGGGVVHVLSWDDAHGFYYLPDGPILPTDESLAADVTQGLMTTVRERMRREVFHVTHLRIEPRSSTLPPALAALDPIPAPEDGWSEPRHTLVVDLRSSETGILAQMRPKGRYNVALARRHGVTVVEDTTPEGVDDFLRIYHDTTDRKSLKGKPDEYFHELMGTLLAQRVGTLLFAEHEGVRLATAIIVFFGQRATYFFGGSLARDRQLMAPYLLHFEAMRRSKARGCESYDLWGIAPENTPDHPWAAISEFKLKFGGQRLTLVPTLGIVLDHAGYAAYLSGLHRS